ncbi:hypothetical protein C8R43DRAFT_964441 [Mycena crocata]|nr:hypothetical protein C8R43DRAFT_964441 [Mycena crocata]
MPDRTCRGRNDPEHCGGEKESEKHNIHVNGVEETPSDGFIKTNHWRQWQRRTGEFRLPASSFSREAEKQPAHIYPLLLNDSGSGRWYIRNRRYDSPSALADFDFGPACNGPVASPLTAQKEILEWKSEAAHCPVNISSKALQATMKGHFGGLIPPHMDSSPGWMNPPCVTSRSPGFIHRPWGGFIHAALVQPDFGFSGPVRGPFGASCWVFSQGSLLCPSYHVS